MKTPLVLILLTAAALLSGCTTVARQNTATAASRYGASNQVVEKIERGRLLTVTDLEELGRRGVPDDVVLAYLRSRDDSYRLSTAQVVRLREAGLGDPVIDYLLYSQERVVRRVRRVYPSAGYGYNSFGRHHTGGFGRYGGGRFGGRSHRGHP